MELIKVTEDKKIKDGWRFLVVIGGSQDPSHHYVTVDTNYWHSLTQEKVDPAELVRQSFMFLLKREPKESILTKFNLKQINQYFPEYETQVRDFFLSQ